MSHRFRTTNRDSPAARARANDYRSSQHRSERARRVKVTTPHDICGYCHLPLGPERLPDDRASRWHLPHNTTRTGYLPGLWHADCNRREAAKRGNAKQRQSLQRDSRHPRRIKPLPL